MECRSCGASNLDGAESCSACGGSLSEKQIQDGASVAGGLSSNSWVLMGVVAVAAVAMVAVMLSAGGSGSGGGGGGGSALSSGGTALDAFTTDSTATVLAVTAEATQTLDLYKSQDYAGVYEQLAASDKAQVSKDEWLLRSTRLESTLGTMTAYTIGDLWYFDPDHSVIAADVEATFDRAKEPVTTTWFFVLENGVVTRTMMWGKEATLTPEPVQ